MKVPLNYAPKYSMSIRFLKLCMSKSEFDDLMRKYIQVKLANWKKGIRGK